MTVLRLTLLLASAGLTACGGSSPSAPGPAGSPEPLSFRGEAVSAIDGRPLSGVTLRIGGQTAVTDGSGAFDVGNLREGNETMTLSSDSVIQRERTVSIPSAAAREALIPASFDLAAFDEMFRGTGRLQRWTTAPGLVVLGSVMQYDSFAAREHFHATSEQLTEDETSLLIAQLTEGLSLLTGHAFTAFSSIEIENPASGDSVNTLRSGKIVVGRYRGLQSLANTIGYGRWATVEGMAEVIGGAIYLDRNFDRSSEDRRLLRIHELGHALGYLHVTVRRSIMNPAIGPEPSDFDRQAAVIGFQRMPGNQSPDSDLTGSSGSTGIFGQPTPSRRTLWSPPID